MAWALNQAVELCTLIESVCPTHGCHVALTGGTLYKQGARKDVDVLFYRIRQRPEIDMQGLFAAIAEVGITVVSDHGWCVKATYADQPVDMFFPEREGQEYPNARIAKEEVNALCLASDEVLF